MRDGPRPDAADNTAPSPAQTAPAGSLIEFRNVARVYGTGEAEVRALNGVSFAISRGEFVAIMGPSGSGKSTAMNIVGCLDRPSSGEYLFEGVEIGQLDRDGRALLRRHYLGFIFQGFNLLARTSALENVELPLIYKGVPRPERIERARIALAKVGLQGREGHDPSQLSGGQQQRVAIARALAGDPQVILADEPTGNLDTANGEAVMGLLKEAAAGGATVVMVTHSLVHAAEAQRTIKLLDGRVVSETLLAA